MSTIKSPTGIAPQGQGQSVAAPQQQRPPMMDMIRQILALIGSQYGSPQGLNTIEQEKVAARQSQEDARRAEIDARNKQVQEMQIQDMQRRADIAPQSYADVLQRRGQEDRAGRDYKMGGGRVGQINPETGNLEALQEMLQGVSGPQTRTGQPLGLESIIGFNPDPAPDVSVLRDYMAPQKPKPFDLHKAAGLQALGEAGGDAGEAYRTMHPDRGGEGRAYSQAHTYTQDINRLNSGLTSLVSTPLKGMFGQMQPGESQWSSLDRTQKEARLAQYMSNISALSGQRGVEFDIPDQVLKMMQDTFSSDAEIVQFVNSFRQQ